MRSSESDLEDVDSDTVLRQMRVGLSIVVAGGLVPAFCSEDGSLPALAGYTLGFNACGLILVTDRNLYDLRPVTGDFHFVDGVVAENGTIFQV